MYIFVAIGIGLGAGIGCAWYCGGHFIRILRWLRFFIWKLEYGKTLAGPFLTMLTRRDAGDDDY